MIGKTNSQTGGAVKSEKLNISLSTNQSSHVDILGAIVTVASPSGTTQYEWDGYEITTVVPSDVYYEVYVSDVDGYKTPDRFATTAVADNARTISFEYKAEKVKVNISSSNGMDMTGANVSINGKDYTYQGSSIEALVPFGTEYSVQAALVGSLVTPLAQSFTASIPLREINLEYRTCALVVNMLSNQENDTTIAALKASVTYGSTTIEVANGEMVDIPSGTDITVTFPEVENYNTPSAIVFTSVSGINTQSATYTTESVTVNVHANEGTLSNFEVLLTGRGVVGVANKYTKLEYIESNGNQHIKTGIIADANTVIKMKFSDLKVPKSGDFALIGSEWGDFSLLYSSTNAIKWFSGNSVTATIKKTSVNEVTLSNHSIITNGIEYSVNGKTSFSNKDIWLFNTGDDGAGTSWRGIARIYSLQIIQDGELVRDYVPALRDDGIAGLYDRINDTFTAPTGSENLIAGDEGTDIMAIQTNVTATYKIPFGESYSIIARDVNGFHTPSSQTFIANEAKRVVDVAYIYLGGGKLTVIRIDQNITDPETMITRIVDEGGIEAVRANSHRYTGSVNENGIMELKQLSDINGEVYTDTSHAELTALGVDVWMKLPKFYWKCVEYTNDVWDFYVAYGFKPDDTYHTWDGQDMIGVYEAYVSSNKVYSVSGQSSTKSTTQADFKKYAKARGEGFSLVKWKHHCMMAMLYYAQYGNTNCQAMIGKGTSSSSKKTGTTNSLGMIDTVAGVNGDNMSINFFGLENWWGNCYEIVDNISINNRVWTVVEDDGIERVVGTSGGGSAFISKMLFGDNIDLMPIITSGSESTGFCDYTSQSTSNNLIVLRSLTGNNTKCGVVGIDAGVASDYSGTTCTTRLAFQGNYVIIE